MLTIALSMLTPFLGMIAVAAASAMYGDRIGEALQDLIDGRSIPSNVSAEDAANILEAIQIAQEQEGGWEHSVGHDLAEEFSFTLPSLGHPFDVLESRTRDELLGWSRGVLDKMKGHHPGPNDPDPNKKPKDPWQRAIAGAATSMATKLNDTLEQLTNFLSEHNSGANKLSSYAYKWLVDVGRKAVAALEVLEKGLVDDVSYGVDMVQKLNKATNAFRQVNQLIDTLMRNFDTRSLPAGTKLFHQFLVRDSLAYKQIWNHVTQSISRLK